MSKRGKTKPTQKREDQDAHYRGVAMAAWLNEDGKMTEEVFLGLRMYQLVECLPSLRTI